MSMGGGERIHLSSVVGHCGLLMSGYRYRGMSNNSAHLEIISMYGIGNEDVTMIYVCFN